MSDLVRPLVDEIKSDLRKLKIRMGALEWISKEYSRYMIVSSDDYADCLDAFIEENPDEAFCDIAKILLKHLDKYGSTKAIYRSATEMLEEFKTA